MSVTILRPEYQHDKPFHQACRIIEALLFASSKSLSAEELQKAISSDILIKQVLKTLQTHYQGRGIELVHGAGLWMFQTASDLDLQLASNVEQRKLSRVALEVLAIIAYHQPVTRADIEDIRGVATSKGTLDLLLETGWVRIRGRRKVPGRPVTFGTTLEFPVAFGFDKLEDLPGLDDLKALHLVDASSVFLDIPTPKDDALHDNEELIEKASLALHVTNE